jgi:hypothetical protein
MRRFRPHAFTFFCLIIAGAGCATPEKKMEGLPSRSAKLPQAAPVITQFFSSPQIAPGKVWKVYLKASDADGDMKEFVCTVHQPGMGTYPVSITGIKEKYRGELSGYLYLVIPFLDGLDNVGIEVTIQIRDRAGQFSQPVKLPLYRGYLAKEEAPPPGVFQENDLGPIMVELRTVGGLEQREPFRLRR